MNCSIFIKTWKADLCWLKYCVRFLEKNWKESSTELVIVADKDCADELAEEQLPLDGKIHFCEPWRDGYSHAMYIKACADEYCHSDHILLLDSDAMLQVPGDLGAFIIGKRPVIAWVSYPEHLRKHPMSPWQRVTERIMQMKPWQHFVERMPVLYFADTLKRMRQFVSAQWGGIPFETLVRSDVEFDYEKFLHHPISFVDYDVISFYASLYEGDQYAFRHTSELGKSPFTSYHSWTEWRPELAEYFEDKLALGVPA